LEETSAECRFAVLIITYNGCLIGLKIKENECMPISSNFPFKKQVVEVLGQHMAYVDEGEGDPIVFVHGNPTSSYLWRNILPYLIPHGRCIALDLVGYGHSDKLPNSGPERYGVEEQRKYFAGFMDALQLKENVTFVIHDWGSSLGFDWANHHRDRMKAIAYMEGIVMPLTMPERAEDQNAAEQFVCTLRTEQGEKLVLEDNLFIEYLLPELVLRRLDEVTMNHYRYSFEEAGEDRRPTLSFPRDIPFNGKPEGINKIVSDYSIWMAENDLPKFFVKAEPGAAITNESLDYCSQWKNQQQITVPVIHFIQEDSPDEIGAGIAKWYKELD